MLLHMNCLCNYWQKPSFFCLPSPTLNPHMPTVHCVLGDLPHTLAPAASVPGLWTKVPTVAWFAAFCPRGHLPLWVLAQILVHKVPSPDQALSSTCRLERPAQLPAPPCFFAGAGAARLWAASWIFQSGSYFPRQSRSHIKCWGSTAKKESERKRPCLSIRDWYW